jgi:hypothetical protein
MHFDDSEELSRQRIGSVTYSFNRFHRKVFAHGTPFWEDVEDLKRSIKPSQIPQIAATFFALAEQFVTEKHSSMSHLARIEGTDFVHDRMFTNYEPLSGAKATGSKSKICSQQA